MRRRDFVSSAVWGLPVLDAFAGRGAVRAQGDSASRVQTPWVEKAKAAMLCRQRASWEQGVAMQGLMEIGDDELVVLMASEATLRRSRDGRLAMMDSGSNVTDPGANGPGVLHAYRVTGDERFKQAADDLYRYYQTAAPKTASGTLRHLTSRTQVWSDSPFMAPPFIAFYGDCDEAVKQMDGYWGYLWDSESKLLSHRYDDEKKAFDRKDFWGGGNGWSAAGLAQIIEVLPPEKTAERKRLVAYGKNLLDGCIAHMRPDGLFHDVIDRPDTFVETNLSQMLAYSIYKGVKAGWLDREYLGAADKMRAAAHGKIDKYGVVQDACGSPSFDRPGTSTEAQAFVLLMEGAYARLKA